MNISEARSAVRRVYDQWVALAKLHEVLELAETLEATLSTHEAQKAAIIQECVDLKAQHDADMQSANDELISIRSQRDDALAAARKEFQSIMRDLSKAKEKHSVVMADLGSQVELARQSYTAQLEGYQTATREAEERLATLRNDLRTMKQHAMDVAASV